MRCFYAEATERHDPVFRLTHGAVLRNAESAERAGRLREGLGRLGLAVEEPPEAPREALLAVHTGRFLDFLQTAWALWRELPGAGAEVVPNLAPQRAGATYPESVVGRAGWHMGDTSCPIGEHSWEAARRSADAALAAADAVLAGEAAAYALCRPPGHHADADTAAGHCLINNAALAAERLRAAHERVAVLDIDVHHGNGTQAIFYGRPDVLTVSVHAATERYYPFYTGHAHETGEGEGKGANLNLPLPLGSRDGPWLDAVAEGLDRVARFAPGALVLSLGLDAHEGDPLAGLRVTTEGFERAGALIAEARLPMAIVQEGGYLGPALASNLAAALGGFLGLNPTRPAGDRP